MFQKLIKYEAKAYAKTLLFIIIGIMCITILGVVSILLFNPDKLFKDNLVGFMNMTSYIGILMVYYFGLIACSLATLLIIATRYYKTMYTDEGYLTHTLPVTQTQLFCSKLFSAYAFQLLTFFMIIMSIIAIMGTILIRLAPIEDFSSTIIDLIHEFIDMVGIMQAFYYGIFYFLLGLVSMFTGIITIYASITLGQLFVKHRIIGAITAYFIINVILSIISFALKMISGIISVAILDFELMSIQYYNTYYAFIFLLYIIQCTVLILITIHQLNKNLNLE